MIKKAKKTTKRKASRKVSVSSRKALARQKLKKKMDKLWGVLKLDTIDDFSEVVLDVYAYRARGCDTTHVCMGCQSC